MGQLDSFQTTVPIESMISLVQPPGSQDYPILQTPGDPFFGTVLNTLRENLITGGSELGTGIMLFSLAVSIRAKTILEIGRHRGFSTFALASALKFVEQGWDEPAHNHQRPDVDYPKHESREKGHLFSIDVVPNPAAEELIAKHGLERYVTYINQNSRDCVPTDIYDLMLIDGDHTFKGCLADVNNFVPKYLRPGGYFILHDYYGWYDERGINNSPIKHVIEYACYEYEQVLIDTGYQSFMIFRKPALHDAAPNAFVEEAAGDHPETLDLDTSQGLPPVPVK